MPWEPNKWILLLDRSNEETRTISYEQIEACKHLGHNPDAMFCDEHPDIGACKVVPQLPAWCNPQQNQCVLGLHLTAAEFDAMENQLKKKSD
jgi:hypothetical protein